MVIVGIFFFIYRSEVETAAACLEISKTSLGIPPQENKKKSHSVFYTYLSFKLHIRLDAHF